MEKCGTIFPITFNDCGGTFPVLNPPPPCIGGARASCTIVQWVHNAIVVVHNGCAPLRTGCATACWWCTMVVHHCAHGTHCHIGGAQWLCSIVHRLHIAILMVHERRAPLCNGCTTPYWLCTIVVHHCAPGAQCHIGGVQWSCTIVHWLHSAILVVHSSHALFCTGFTTPYWWCTVVVHRCAPCAGPPYWWCTMVVHHCAPGAPCHIGGG